MKKETLIKKWLDNQLTEEELQEFQQLEEYDSFMKLSEKSHFFKAPTYDSLEAYKALHSIIERKRIGKSLLQRLNPFVKVAAILIVSFSIYSLFYSNRLSTTDTLAGHNSEVVLPDASIVHLNSLSQLSYNKRKWRGHREVKLIGEAFFKVAKGSQFDVLTSSGTVSVLGTQFNVKNRDNYFEVKCFEGKVLILRNNERLELPAGNTLRVVQGRLIKDFTDLHYPTWIDNFSSFKSVLFSEVINEFERQYNVEFSTDVATDILFTGKFVHDNIDLALKSISLPFNLQYRIKNNVITLHKIE